MAITLTKRERKLARCRENQKRSYWKKRNFVNEYKSSRGCSICEKEFRSYCLDFHHIDDSEKDFNVGASLSSWKKLESELEKCIVVCANCHREIHYGGEPDGDYSY